MKTLADALGNLIENCETRIDRAFLAVVLEFLIDPVGNRVGNPRELSIVSGVGLVVGLDGAGCPTPKGELRSLLEKELIQQKLEDIPKLLGSDNCAMVFVSAAILPGAHKNDSLDVEVTLPPGNQSKATSLRGGYLLGCSLRNYSSP